MKIEGMALYSSLVFYENNVLSVKFIINSFCVFRREVEARDPALAVSISASAVSPYLLSGMEQPPGSVTKSGHVAAPPLRLPPVRQ